MRKTRTERILEIREQYKGKNMDIIPSKKAMQRFYEILTPSMIEVIKREKQNNKNIS